jgi:hypothetical protein
VTSHRTVVTLNQFHVPLCCLQPITNTMKNSSKVISKHLALWKVLNTSNHCCHCRLPLTQRLISCYFHLPLTFYRPLAARRTIYRLRPKQVLLMTQQKVSINSFVFTNISQGNKTHKDARGGLTPWNRFRPLTANLVPLF